MALAVKRMTDLDLRGKRVLIREDLNVPVKDGRVTSTARLDAALPTLRAARDAGARVMVMSHLGRPKAGKPDPESSLAPVAAKLGELFGSEGPARDEVARRRRRRARRDRAVRERALREGRGIRRRRAREENGEALRRVRDGCVRHRAPRAGEHQRRRAPRARRVRRARCSSPSSRRSRRRWRARSGRCSRSSAARRCRPRSRCCKASSSKVDELILGGGIANTVLAAAGFPVGKSLHEADMVDFAKKLLDGKFGKAKVPLPTDVVVATSLEPSSRGKVKRTKDVAADEMILDIGPETAAFYAERLERAGTIVWNGPVGVFEHHEFAGWDAPRGGGRRSEQSVLDCGRRRHARGNRAVRGRGQDLVHLDGRRRIPRVPRGQEAARGCDARGAREALSAAAPVRRNAVTARVNRTGAPNREG